MISSFITFLTSLLLLKVTDRVHAFLTVHPSVSFETFSLGSSLSSSQRPFPASPSSGDEVALLLYHTFLSLSRPFFEPLNSPSQPRLKLSSAIIPFLQLFCQACF